MSNKVLLDVNVCLDVLLKRKPFSDAAARLFQSIEQKKTTAVISAISFDTMFYVLRPAIGKEKATNKLNDLTLHIAVGTVDSSVVRDALNASWRDLEDALHYFTATNSNCDAIISRNQKDFKKAEIPVLSPTEYLAKLNRFEEE